KKDEKQDQPKEYGKNKPQPQKFKSGELTQGDVNKILGEIKQQEQKIRAEFNKKETKDEPRDKDW
ncbi:MAG: tetratricopeptide repeat protein, partial [Pseudobdellovibrionaceae bacterium]